MKPILNGWHGDTSRMHIVGEAPLKARRLVELAYQEIMAGVAAAKPGNHLGNIGPYFVV